MNETFNEAKASMLETFATKPEKRSLNILPPLTAMYGENDANNEKSEICSTLSHNFSLLKERGLKLCELRSAQVREAAELLFSDIEELGLITENELLISQYRDIANELLSAYRSELDENNKMLTAFNESEETELRIRLCSEICRSRERNGFPLTFENFFPPHTSSPSENDRIAYLKNPYSDEAYRTFASVLNSASLTYAQDFTGVCEEVYYGRARYCILPTEASSEGTLSGFRKLSQKYDLNPVLSCFVSARDGSQTTRFSLLSKGIERVRLKAVDGAKEFFVFRLNAPNGTALLNSIKCIHACGLRLSKVDSEAVAWDEGRYSLELTAMCTGGDLPALLCYLSLEVPEYIPIGIYTQLQSAE